MRRPDTHVNVDLVDTDASRIAAALLQARRRLGSVSYTSVLTLVVVTEEAGQYDAVRGALRAARQHPARILAVVGRPAGNAPRLDAEVRASGESGPGEVVVLRLHGPLAGHADSVVLPLLLPDAPVVTWWPGSAPPVPAEDPLGQLAQRRITDAAQAPDPLAEIRGRPAGYAPGDTDFSWTRLTPWRSLLAATLDAPYAPVTEVVVGAEAGNPSAPLLASWLSGRLGVPAQRQDGPGPGITEARLRTRDGDILVHRPDGQTARLIRPGWPERPVALPRRGTADLLAEELRRLDPDEVYGAALVRLGDAAELAAPAGTGG